MYVITESNVYVINMLGGRRKNIASAGIVNSIGVNGLFRPPPEVFIRKPTKIRSTKNRILIELNAENV